MLLLGIESSCDETAAAVVEDGRKILSSVIASQVEEHKIYGGVVPEIASRRHSEAISGVVGEALSQSGKSLSDLDGIAVTYAPGLIGALLVGGELRQGPGPLRRAAPRPGAPFAGGTSPPTTSPARSLFPPSCAWWSPGATAISSG